MTGGSVKFDPVTFTANGTWCCPRGVKQIAVDCVAAQGYTRSASAGLGGRVQCILNVTAGNILYIVVGVERSSGSSTEFNSSDIRLMQNDLYSRLIVAGGGGSSYHSNQKGGDGGGLKGGDGQTTSASLSVGFGGTQTTGGESPLVAGSFGYGGYTSSQYKANGGDGWYGGGSGNRITRPMLADKYSSGGGGSSYTHPTLCSNVVHTQGFRAGNGYVTISMV